MKLVARKGDNSAGICDVGADCCPHSWTGPIITGALTHTTESKATARIGDLGSCRCPHGGIYMIVSGAKRSYTEK